MSFKGVVSFLLSVSLALCLTAPAAAGEGSWTSVGPSIGVFGINQATAVATHPGSPQTVWVAMSHGGVLRSTDRGLTFRTVGEELAAVRGLAVDLSAPGALWAATPTAIFHTGDAGDHWQPVSNDSLTAALGDQQIVKLAATPGSVTTLYAWTLRRALESLDGGRSWRQVVDVGEGSWIDSLAPAGPGLLYLATGSSSSYELSKTRDGGAHWTVLSCPGIDHGIRQIAVSPKAVFLSPDTGSTGLLRSTDGGATWREALTGNDFSFSVLVDPLTPGTVWALGGNPRTLWISRDDGETWDQRSTPDALELAAAGPEPGSLYGNLSHSIARSTNGGRTWVEILPLFSDPDRPSCRISFQPGQPSRITFVKGHALFRSNDGGTTWWWLPKAPTSTNDAVLDAANPNRLTTVGLYSSATTTNGGRTWSTKPLGYAELVVRATPKTLFAGGCGVQRSRDNGKTWAQVLSCSSPRDRRAGQYVQKIVIDPVHPKRVFALVFLDREFYPNHGPMYYGLPTILWRSDDDGRTWKNISVDLDAFDFDAESSRLWIARGTDLLVSHDLGASWQVMAQVPLAREHPDWYGITDLATPPGLPGTLYVAGGPNLLRTQNEGRTWESVAPGGEMLLTLKPGDPRTVFGLGHEGLFQLQLPE